MTDKEIIERAKEAEKRTGFGQLVHSPISKGVNSAFGIGFIEGMVEYRKSLQGKTVSEDFTKALAECIHQAQCAVVDPMAHADIWKKELLELAKGKMPVSEDLEEAAHQYYEPNDKFMDGFKKGAKWQKENLWKPADGDDLPEIDREVIALLDNDKVVFAHRPPRYWDGKNIVTGKVTRYYPKTYDKGGWNIPNVKYWLDCLMPNIEED